MLSFIVAFGAAKALTNLAAGSLASRVGRRRLLLLGWLLALPVERVVPSHGDPVLTDARAELERALAEKTYIAATNVDTRELRWQAAARMLADNPVLGVGPGGFRSSYVAGFGARGKERSCRGFLRRSYRPRLRPDRSPPGRCRRPPAIATITVPRISASAESR